MSTAARPSEIEGEIREKRSEMDHTIDALKAKLSPGEMLDQVIDYVRDGGGEIGQGFGRKVRENPVPLAMMAASMAWLMMSDRRPAGRSHDDYSNGNGRVAPDAAHTTAYGYQAHEDFEEPNDDDYETISVHDRYYRAMDEVKRRADETNEAYNQRLYEARARALGLKQNAEEQVEAFNQRVDRQYRDLTERARLARHKASAHAAYQRERARRGLHDAGRATRHHAERAGDEATRFYQENPLVVGALGLAAGALLGGILPASRREDELIGRYGDMARSEVRERAEEAGLRASEAVSRTADAARDEAHRQGLTPDHAEASAQDLTERARRVGERSIEAGRNEAKREIEREGHRVN